MKLLLYYAPMTCALVPYVTLTEAGADFEVKNLNTRANQHKTPQFLSLNPKHKVPVLVVDRVHGALRAHEASTERPESAAYEKDVQDEFAKAASS